MTVLSTAGAAEGLQVLDRVPVEVAEWKTCLVGRKASGQSRIKGFGRNHHFHNLVANDEVSHNPIKFVVDRGVRSTPSRKVPRGT